MTLQGLLSYPSGWSTETLVSHIASLSPCLHLNFCLSGEADPVVQEKSNASNYNIKIFLSVGNKEIQDIGVLYDEGRKCVMKGLKSYRKFRTYEKFLKDMQGYRV